MLYLYRAALSMLNTVGAQLLINTPAVYDSSLPSALATNLPNIQQLLNGDFNDKVTSAKERNLTGDFTGLANQHSSIAVCWRRQFCFVCQGQKLGC
jgi:hypothetical protein